jgi:anti-sigma regulatory factor (Ser/Thr protein kinase)
MAVSEVVANTCIHAYRVGMRGSFSLEGAIAGDDVQLTVRDDGAWRAPRTTGGGRGLQIVKAVVRDMSIDRSDAGTTVTMTARFRN